MARTNSVDSSKPTTVSATTASVRSNFAVLKASDERVFDLVAHYGCDPTGATANQSQVQAAVNDCLAAGGGTILVPVGKIQLAGIVTVKGADTVESTVPVGLKIVNFKGVSKKDSKFYVNYGGIGIHFDTETGTQQNPHSTVEDIHFIGESKTAGSMNTGIKKIKS